MLAETLTVVYGANHDDKLVVVVLKGCDCVLQFYHVHAYKRSSWHDDQ